ncbi:hypothetical protein [Paludisphaera mucosa]|uniref:Uncharacterized protein n=1 Tax=Paludisphaera mucosa TaxID=3030827 RepID=A0ABT6FLT1_9BACT|nr:hypothetical protein [Paludisphaera mucosa]MDG3008524.1 hypothetical protein [Paludisphaera mucosa]
MASRRRAAVWDDWTPPPDPTQALIDVPYPSPWTELEPLFPMAGLPFTPSTPCPHRCKLCSGAGSFSTAEGEFFAACPDCGGTGAGPIPAGSTFVCMMCHAAGKDGTRALPLGVEPLPVDKPKPEPQTAAERKRSRKERRKLKKYVSAELAKLSAQPQALERSA